jgi:hypothetical protein
MLGLQRDVVLDRLGEIFDGIWGQFYARGIQPFLEDVAYIFGYAAVADVVLHIRDDMLDRLATIVAGRDGQVLVVDGHAHTLVSPRGRAKPLDVGADSWAGLVPRERASCLRRVGSPS